MASINESSVDENECADVRQGLLVTAYLRGLAALRSLLRARTRDASAADDLLQDMWFRVHRAGDGRGVRDPGAFLRTVAGNLAMDWNRRRTMIANLSGAPEQAEEVACGRPSAFEELVAEETVAFLMTVIEEIPPRRREAFLLHRVEGLTIAEAATRMGTKPDTVERQVAQALSYCQARLLEFGWKP